MMITITWSRRTFIINSILLNLFSSLIAGIFVWAVSSQGLVNTLKEHYLIVICSIVLWLVMFVIEIYRSKWEKNREAELEQKLVNREDELKIEIGARYRRTAIFSLKKSFKLFVCMIKLESGMKVNLHMFWFQKNPEGGRLYKIRDLSAEEEMLPGGCFLDYLDIKKQDYFATCQAFFEKKQIYLDLFENPPEYRNEDEKMVDPAQHWVLAMPVCASAFDQHPYGVLVFFGRQDFYKEEEDRAWFTELAYLLTELVREFQENAPDGKGLIKL